MSAPDTPEFPYPVDIRGINAEPVELHASAAQREALAARFAIVAVKRLEARIALYRKGQEVAANGMISADIVQSCAVSGEDLPVTLEAPVDLVFVPEEDIASEENEEIELSTEELDQIGYTGTSFDLGEAIAQTLALAIDPYALGPDAEIARREHGLIGADAHGPLAAALAALKKSE